MAVTDTGGYPVCGRAGRNVPGDHRSGTHESVLADDDASQDDRAGADLRAPLKTWWHKLRFPADLAPDQLPVINGSDSRAKEHPVGQHAVTSDVGAG